MALTKPTKAVPKSALFLVAPLPRGCSADYLDAFAQQLGPVGKHLGLDARQITSDEIAKVQNSEHRFAVVAIRRDDGTIYAKTFKLAHAGTVRPLDQNESSSWRYKSWLKLSPAPQVSLEALVIRGTDDRVVEALKSGSRQLYFCCWDAYAQKVLKRFSSPDLPKFPTEFPPWQAAELNEMMERAKGRVRKQERERREMLKPNAAAKSDESPAQSDVAKPKRSGIHDIFED